MKKQEIEISLRLTQQQGVSLPPQLFCGYLRPAIVMVKINGPQVSQRACTNTITFD